MVFSYYPGCTLKTKAKHLEKYARDAASVLGIQLEEIDTWQCCNAVYPLAKDELATRLSSVRALNAAKQKEQKLVTLCSACHHVIKRVNHDIKTDADMCRKINNYLELSEPYTGTTDVLHFLEVLRDEVGFSELAAKVVNPLTDQKIGAYYGCMLLRPSTVMQFDDPENPTIMEDFIRAIGATPVVYAYRNECCGGYVTLNDSEQAVSMVSDICRSARSAGAQMLISACPLCNYNLEQNAPENLRLPVYYFTQLLAQALGIEK